MNNLDTVFHNKLLLHFVTSLQTLAGIIEVDGTLAFVNSAPLKASCIEQKDVIGKKIWDCIWWNYDVNVQAIIQNDCEQAAKGKKNSREIQFYAPEGLHWISFNIQPVLDESNKVIYLVAEGQSIAKRKQAEQTLRNSEHKYRTLFEKSADAILLIDGEVFIDCNPAAIAMLGYKNKQELLNSHPSQLSPPVQADGRNSFEKANEMIATAFEKGSHRFEWDHKRYNDKVFPVEVLLTVVPFGGKELLHVVWRDITQRKKSEALLRLTSRVFSDTHEGVIITDSHTNIVDVNPAFSDITGYSRKESIGQTPHFLASGKQSYDFFADMWSNIIQHDYWNGELWNRKKNGDFFAESLTISTLRNTKEEIENYVGVFTDITKSKKQQERLEQMAHYDLLTGLPNRTLFSDRFTQAIAHSKRTKSQLAICFLDLDHFKSINDTYGHNVGDQFLIQVAKRINSSIRGEDTAARQGGDEFTLLLRDIKSYAQCEEILRRIQQSIAQPYLFNGTSHKATVSMGVTLYPSDNSDIDTLIRHADHAMYQSKQSGRNRYHFFSTLQDQQAVRKYHQLDEIKQALISEQFSLYYQPKVNMVTGEVFGAEALIRWIHPNDGLIPPLDFLPIIEGSELEIQIGDWVINQAIKQLDYWHQQGIKIEVSINISSHHLQSENFTAQLNNALAKYPDVHSRYLQLEILESSALGDLNTISRIIKYCRDELGINAALDDFGTGYSSLTHLRSLPVNIIKIDQSFVKNILEDPDDTNIINGIIGLANSFNRKIIAEGVESTEHGLMLLMMGCKKAQGYGIAKPMPALDLPDWLKNYSPNQEWISSAKKANTLQEKKITLFKLTLKQWHKHFESNIQSPPDSIKHWPLMKRTKCHCGLWIMNAKKEQLFEETWLKKLDDVHHSIHDISDNIFKQYNQGKIDFARNRLKEIQQVSNKINQLLEQCE